MKKLIIEYEDDRCLELVPTAVDYIEGCNEIGEKIDNRISIGENEHEYNLRIIENKKSYRIYFFK